MRDLFRLLALFRGQWGWMSLGALLALTTMLANIGLMTLSGWFISTMALAGVAGITINYFTPAAFIRGLAIMRTAGRYGERLVTHDATLRVLSDIRIWFYQSLEPLVPARLESWRSGDLLNRIQSDIDDLDGFYINSWIPILTAILSITVIGVFVASFSPIYSLVLIGLLLLGGVGLPAMTYLGSRKPVHDEQVLRSDLRNTLLDDVSGMAELRVYMGKTKLKQQLQARQQHYIRSQDQINRMNALSQALMGSLSQVAVWLGLLILIPSVSDQKLDGAFLGMLVLLALASFETVASMPLAYQSLGKSLGAARRLFELVDVQPLVTEPEHPRQIPQGLEIEFNHVSMVYPQQKRPAIEEISFRITEGERVAVVGASGAGKTSLMQLLLKFYLPSEGEVKLGGYSVEDYSSEDLRQCFSVASQSTHLFNTTVRANLMMARPDASEESMILAAKRARIHDEIMAMKDGYDSFVGEAGVRLSGGQIRRMALARAFLRDAPIFLLDEPTEGLDLNNQHLIMDILASEFQGKSLLLITHNLAGLESMDKIIVLEKGRMVEQGDHNSLLKAGGRYADFWQTLGRAS